MKKGNIVVTLIGVLYIILSSFTISKKGPQLNRESGLYIVTNDQGAELRLNDTGEFYDFKKTPLIRIKDISLTTLGFTPIINGKRYPRLTLTLDSIAINAMKKIVNDQKIGLILNNKLRIVATYPFLENFEGSTLDLQGSSGDSISEFEALKKEIDTLH